MRSQWMKQKREPAADADRSYHAGPGFESVCSGSGPALQTQAPRAQRA